MREKIVELLKERDLSVEELSVLLNCNSKDFVRLNKEVNQLVSDRLAVFDDKNNKYYEITSDGEEEISEKVIKKMWQLTFGIKFDDMIK